MRKIFLFMFAFLICLCDVNASESYFMWHNSIDNAYTTSYDGMISNEVGKYQNDTIEALGDYRIRLNNFNTYDVMLYKESNWEINGENTINFIEESAGSIINLSGNGVLRFQEIGLSMNDMLNYQTPNLEERIKTYLNGNYTLSIEEKYIVLRLNNPVNNENSLDSKVINFENKGFNIKIKSNSKVPMGTVFIAENKMDSLKEEIEGKINKEDIKYIYNFKLQDGEDLIEPSDEVEVRIKIDNGKYIVYYYNNDKELEKIDSKYENDTLIFKTSHFSEFVITSPKEDKEEIEDKKIEEEKDYTLIICASIFIVSVIILILVLATNGKRS